MKTKKPTFTTIHNLKIMDGYKEFAQKGTGENAGSLVLTKRCTVTVYDRDPSSNDIMTLSISQTSPGLVLSDVVPAMIYQFQQRNGFAPGFIRLHEIPGEEES
jgi:hypothetical protein